MTTKKTMILTSKVKIYIPTKSETVVKNSTKEIACETNEVHRGHYDFPKDRKKVYIKLKTIII